MDGGGLFPPRFEKVYGISGIARWAFVCSPSMLSSCTGYKEVYAFVLRLSPWNK